MASSFDRAARVCANEKEGHATRCSVSPFGFDDKAGSLIDTKTIAPDPLIVARRFSAPLGGTNSYSSKVPRDRWFCTAPSIIFDVGLDVCRSTRKMFTIDRSQLVI
jgi:hypothetical protein